MARPTDTTVILSIVSDWFNVPIKEMLGHKRNRSIVLARQTAIFFIKRRTNLSTVEIGELMNRDHTSVMHAASKIDERINTDSMWRIDMDEVDTAIMDAENDRIKAVK